MSIKSYSEFSALPAATDALYRSMEMRTSGTCPLLPLRDSIACPALTLALATVVGNYL